MTKKKALKRTFVAEIDLKTTFAELVSSKKEGRPPKQVGQGRSSRHVRLHGVTINELKKRLDAAEVILEKGVPKKKKSTAPAEGTKNPGKKEELHNYLKEHGVEYHAQLGEKKLQALVNEHKASAPPVEKP